MNNTQQKYEDLKKLIAEYGKAAVAFSGVHWLSTNLHKPAIWRN
ncbi:MAG: hypothetical protein ACYSSK_07910 [Planctomycetota bacterium]